MEQELPAIPADTTVRELAARIAQHDRGYRSP